MSDVNDLHNKAMDLAEWALLARLRGYAESEADLARQALEMELAAIQELKEPIEPTFSVLHRSAGTLALRCGDYRLAEQIAAKALAQEPSPQIAEELRDLIEQVHFQRHLSLRGIELGEDEMQMSLSGTEVGYGMVASKELVSRIENASRMIGRIVEWKMGLSFARRGPRKATREGYPVLVSAPRAASFAVTLKVGRPTGKLRNPGETREIIDEFMDFMDLVSASDLRALEARISDPLYLDKFIDLAKKIGPDGRRVRQVGFTVERSQKIRRVSVTSPSMEIPTCDANFIPAPPALPAKLGKVAEIRGTLCFADATDNKNGSIRILTNDGECHSVEMPIDRMNHIVSSMWNSRVIVTGLRRGQSIVLQDIALDE